MGENSLIEIKELSKKFGKKEILKNINLNIKESEIIGIIGPSGQGKTVLIKTLIGFYKPNHGEIKYFIPEEKINFSMQNNSIYESLTLKQNWNYFAKINNIKRKERKIIIENLLEQLNLKEFKNTITRNLSGGTQKRVDIGCSLLTNPKLIILDEPFTGLDPELIKKITDYLKLLKNQKRTIMIVSHRIKLMTQICDRIFSLKNKGLREIDKDKIWDEYDELE